MTEREIKETTDAVRALEADMKAGGAWVFGGRLHDPSTATVVRAAGDDVMITDGPFAETKDHLGGLYVLRTEDLDGTLGLGGQGGVWPHRQTAIRCGRSWPR